jgi:3-isopropylmalate/(R)-2-methylmalate dehydratase small subunit
MEPFTRLTAVALPIDQANINTDQIFPARFLKKPRAQGYAAYLFHDIRFNRDGTEDPAFVLNEPRYRKARILVANSNFGCGSSREGAVYTLQDFGFRALIAPSFGDIFAANCVKNGVVPVVLPQTVVAELRHQLRMSDDPMVTVDLVQQEVAGPDGRRYEFAIEPFPKHCLLNGIDEIEFTLQHEANIAAFEQGYRADFEWLFRSRPEGGSTDS